MLSSEFFNAKHLFLNTLNIFKYLFVFLFFIKFLFFILYRVLNTGYFN